MRHKPRTMTRKKLVQLLRYDDKRVARIARRVLRVPGGVVNSAVKNDSPRCDARHPACTMHAS
jgi:hypothetical protein